MVDLLGPCLSYGDLTAGSPEERRFLEAAVAALDLPGVWMHLSPVEVLHWRDLGSSMEVDGGELRVLAMPYSRGGEFEGRLEPLDGDVEGAIAVAQWPAEVDDAKYLAMEAAARGAVALVLAGSPLRRIVVTGEAGFKLDAAPTPLPVASAGPEVLAAVGRRARLRLHVESRVTYSYSLVAMNTFEESPMISAHYDHWLSGATDNCGGVQAAAEAFLALVAEDRPAALALFTAEEGVGPHVPSLYWAWGSRRYLERWRPTLLVNIDVVGLGSPRIYAMPYLHGALGGLGPLEPPAPYFDSLNYEVRGLPALTISSLRETWHVYHSPLDAEVDRELVSYAAELARRAARVEPRPPSVDLSRYGLPPAEDPYRAWAHVYNYLVVFGRRHSEILYVNVYEFLRREGKSHRRIDLLGGPTLCLGDCGEAVEAYRELAAV